jgi:hypothetical protein
MNEGFVVGAFPMADEVVELSVQGGAPDKLWTAMLIQKNPLPVDALVLDGRDVKMFIARQIVGEWRYLRATDPMADAVVDDWPTGCGHSFRVVQAEAHGWSVLPPWWAVLGGMEGPTGADYLHRIIGGLEADPERFLSETPQMSVDVHVRGDSNTYFGLLDVLRAMRAAVPEIPCEWAVYG